SSIRTVGAEINRAEVRLSLGETESSMSLPSREDSAPASRTQGSTRPLFLTRDRWFESGSLHQRVCCELTRPSRPLPPRPHAADDGRLDDGRARGACRRRYARGQSRLMGPPAPPTGSDSGKPSSAIVPSISVV